jgi:hypothetical protein
MWTAQAQEEAGFIVNMSGAWNVSCGGGADQLRRGQTVLRNCVIRPASSNNPRDFITVSLRNGREFYCTGENLGGCAQPISADGGDTLTRRIALAVLRLFVRDPNRYGSGINRGQKESLQETVLRLEGEQLDLSPVFKDMGAGRYLLRFDRVTNPDGSAEAVPADPIPFDWQPTGARPLIVKGVRAGLYKIVLLEPRDKEHEPTGENVWVLIVQPKSYRQVSRSFKRAVGLTGGWRDRDAAQSFLRAYLDSLSTN